MKLAAYCLTKQRRLGVLVAGGIADIEEIWDGPGRPASMIEALVMGPECIKPQPDIDQPISVRPLNQSVRLLAPIPRPGKILALAGNYSEHIKEAGLSLGLSGSPRKTTVPRPFLIPSTAVAGPGDEIPWPDYSTAIDYEIELAAVIGSKAKRLPPAEAIRCVAGYTIVNDVSARSVSFSKNRKARPWDEFYDWLVGKWADGFLPMGPCIVTADEIGDPQRLGMTLKINGEVRQESDTGRMIFPVAEAVSFLSHITTLEPGDVIATGTPAGVGAATGRFLKAGDVIECTIEKIGTLTNTLGRRPECLYEPL